MKKLFMTALMTVCSLLLLQAQDIQIARGPEYEDAPGTNIVEIIGDDGSGVVMLRVGKGKEYFIEKYSYDMLKIFSNQVMLPKGEKREYEVEELTMANGKVYLFASNYDKESGTNTLYGVAINESGEMAHDPIKLAELSAKNKSRSGSFDVHLAEDSSRFVIVKHESIEKSDGEQVGLKVINPDFSVLWEKDFGMDYKEKNYDLNTVVVDKAGNVHMIAKIYIPAKQRVKGAPAFNYEVFSYFYQNNDLKLYTIDLGENYINDVDIRLTENDMLVGAGFYSEKSTYRMKGVFYFSVDPDSKSVKSVSKKDFTVEFLTNFMSEKKAEKGKELSNYLIREIYTKADGGVVIVAEYYQFTKSTTTTTTNGVTRTTTTYRWYYNDLIIADVNPSGEINHYSYVAKKQTYSYSTSGTGYGVSFASANTAPVAYLGIATLFNKDQMYVVYNDNPKNITIADPKKMKYMSSAKGSVTTLATVDKDGNVSKLPLFTARDKESKEKAIVKPRFHVNTSDNTMILFCEFGKKYKFIKLQF